MFSTNVKDFSRREILAEGVWGNITYPLDIHTATKVDVLCEVYGPGGENFRISHFILFKIMFKIFKIIRRLKVQFSNQNQIYLCTSKIYHIKCFFSHKYNMFLINIIRYYLL